MRNNRTQILEVAERATLHTASTEDLEFLDTVIHECAVASGTPVSVVADRLRAEAYVGPHYRSECFDDGVMA